MKSFIEKLAQEDDRLFTKMSWVLGVSVGLFAALATYALLQVYLMGNLPPLFYDFESVRMARAVNDIDLSVVAISATIMFFFPRFIPFGLSALALLFMSFIAR